MSDAHWERLQSLFHGALEQSPEQRRSWLSAQCPDNPSLIDETLQLLEQDARGFQLLDGGVATLAQAVLETPATLLNRTLGSYRLVRLLGEGGMGAVYLAERADLERVVAIKVLRDAGLSPARRTLFTAEQRTLAQLVHPSITRLYDADVTPEGVPYIVMEYVEGEPLTTYCRRHHCTLTQRLIIFRAVCEAVQYAHSHAVIHRDLKPSNILVRPNGTASLLDFGIARHLSDAGTQHGATHTSLRLMTPLYAAPEQLAGGTVGMQTDVYSLGVVLYELLTGSTPFSTEDRIQLQHLIAPQSPQRPSQRVRQSTDAPITLGAADAADLDVLCLTAMHADPEQRYRSVEALIRDIDHFQQRLPLAARPDSLGYRARKFFTRHRVGTLVTAVSLAAALILATVFLLRLQNARNAAIQEAASARRMQAFVTSLLQGGDAEAGPADSLRVQTLLDRGALEAAGLADEPLVQADMDQTLGLLYQNLGRLDRADALLTQALALRRSQPDAQRSDTVASLNALALLRVAQGRLPDAQTLADSAVTIARTLPTHVPGLASALVVQGQVRAEQGQYADAIRILDKARADDERSGSTALEMTTALRALAAANYSAGHYEAARSLYQRLLSVDRQLHGANHPHVADDLGSLGSIQQDLGFYSDAESLSRQALAIDTSYYGADHPRTAAALTMLGRSMLYEKRYPEAEQALQQALAIEEKDYGPVHAVVADTLNELGNVASLHDDYDAAQARFQRVVDIYRSIYGDHHYLLAIALSNVAYVELNRGRLSDAESGFRDVVRRFTETLGPNNVNTGIAHIKLGRSLLRERRFADAAAETAAGYDNLQRQTSPGISFLQAARKDMAAEYAALGQTARATQYQREFDASAPPVAPRH